MNPDLLTAWRRVANDQRGPETVTTTIASGNRLAHGQFRGTDHVTMPRQQLRELIEHIGVLSDVVDLYAPDWAIGGESADRSDMLNGEDVRALEDDLDE